MDFGSIANRDLDRNESDEVQRKFGVNFGARGYEGGALGDSGYDAYHTGTGWGVRQSGSGGMVGEGNGGGLTAAPTNSYSAPNAAAGSTPEQNLAQQGANAQTYSQTPTAGPADQTTNAGMQDVIRNKVLQTMMQGDDISDVTGSAGYRQVADTHAAAQERARRNANDAEAERLGAQGVSGESGVMDNARRLNTEKAAQASSGFEAQLAMSELQNRRQEIQQALAQGQGMLSQDQQMKLQRDLANLDATIKRESLAQSGSLGHADIGLRRDLGYADANLRALALALQNQQFGQGLGAQIGYNEAALNNQALQYLL
jgi:hypothetical protein